MTDAQRTIGRLLRAGLERTGHDRAAVRKALEDYRRTINATPRLETARPSLAASGLGVCRYVRKYGTGAERAALWRLMHDDGPALVPHTELVAIIEGSKPCHEASDHPGNTGSPEPTTQPTKTSSAITSKSTTAPTASARTATSSAPC